jgi:hypothetical protein
MTIGCDLVEAGFRHPAVERRDTERREETLYVTTRAIRHDVANRVEALAKGLIPLTTE